MRLRIHSDLHFEHLPDFGKSLIKSLPVDGDEYLVLAGDILPLARKYEDRTLEALDQLLEKRYKQILFVPGNHEYYRTSISEGYVTLLRMEHVYGHEGFRVLRTGEVTNIEGKRFIGDTMWFPDNPANRKFERHFSDFRLISDIQIAYKENAGWKKFFRDNCQEGDIVVTHHMPSYQSVATEFIGDNYNRFFLSNMSKDIADKKPKLWVHGHTHHQFDYMEGTTRIVANPRGYPFEATMAGWDINKVVEV